VSRRRGRLQQRKGKSSTNPPESNLKKSGPVAYSSRERGRGKGAELGCKAELRNATEKKKVNGGEEPGDEPDHLEKRRTGQTTWGGLRRGVRPRKPGLE